MIGFLKNSKAVPETSKVVLDAINFADTWHYTEPEQTTYRLRQALHQLKDINQDLSHANHYSDLSQRGVMLSSDLRKKELPAADYGRWLAANLSSLGTAKQALKSGLRNPWRNHYDWLGQSLAHSSVLQNPLARRAYEQLAITYRIEQALMNRGENQMMPTNKTGYMIERVLPTAPQIAAKANRLIDHYYSPKIID